MSLEIYNTTIKTNCRGINHVLRTYLLIRLISNSGNNLKRSFNLAKLYRPILLFRPITRLLLSFPMINLDATMLQINLNQSVVSFSAIFDEIQTF